MNLKTVFLALLGGAGAASAPGVPLDAPIVNVTVFPDRALVTRSGSIGLPAGVTEVVIPNLAANLLDESLQVSARADGKLTILDVRSATGFSPPVGMERVQPLLDRKKKLEESIAGAGMRLSVLQQQRNFLTRIEEVSTAPRPEGDLPTPEEWSKLMVFFQGKLADLLPRIHEEEKRKKEIEEELTSVNRQISQTRGAERTATKQAVVRVATTDPIEAAGFSLTYVVMNAGWRPNYNLRVESDEKAILLDYQAMVHQQTGEDWSDISLSLSTARPALGGTPPELGQWNLDVWQPRPAAAPMQMPLRRAGESLAFGDGREMADADFATAVVEASLTAVNLRVPARVSIPADGQPHRVGVTNLSLEGDFYYTVVPKLSPFAFLQSRVTYEGEAPLLAGNASIFMDGNLVGQSRLSRIEPNEEFEVPLGVDEAIRVERKLLRRFVEQRGLISKTTRTRFEFQTIITNNRRTAERIIMNDHVPLSQHERIKVDILEISGGKPDDEKPGHYTWELNLAPGRKAEIPLVFRVEHPEDMQITGL